MKIKNKLLSILAPAFVAGSMTAFVIPMSSCTSETKKEEKKQGTSQIKMSKATYLKDINATDAPFCVLNTDTTRSGSVQINVPASESSTAKLNYQKGTFDPETNTITWDDTWTAIESTSERSTTVTIDHIDYLTPVRFYAYNTDNQGQFSTTGNRSENFNFRFYTKSNPTTGKGIRIAGSAKSLLAKQEIQERAETVETVDDLNENSEYAFCSLFDFDPEAAPIPNANNFVCEVNPGFLPFKTMKQGCYKNMFTNNQYLLAVPDLPSMTLAQQCYYGMFKGCGSLLNAPYLPATILVQDCYSEIFENCQYLSSVAIAYPGTLTENYFAKWLKDSGPRGEKGGEPIVYYDGFDTTYSTARKESENDSTIPSCFKIVSKATTDPDWLNANTTVFEFKDDATFGSPTVDITDYYPSKIRVYNTDPVSVVDAQKPKVTYTRVQGVEVSVHKKNASNQPEKIDMESIATETAKTTLPSTMYLRYIKEQDVVDTKCLNIVAQETSTVFLHKRASGAGLMRFDKVQNKWVTFANGDTITLEKGEILKVYGDIKSTGERKDQKFSVTDYTHFRILGNVVLKGNIMSLLSNKEGEPATTMPRNFCFARLFEESTGITGVDSNFLPDASITLKPGCYYQMFKGCTSLKNPPKLDATTIADSCYCEMFSGCTKLESCPLLPAADAQDYCYRAMFYGCESLTTPADIPFKVMKYWCCESMYMNCTKLTRPAIFNNGNQITEDEDEGTNTRGYSLNNTFRNCSNIRVYKGEKEGAKPFFYCWKHYPEKRWGTGPEGIFVGTGVADKNSYKGPTGTKKQPVDINSGIDPNTIYYYL